MLIEKSTYFMVSKKLISRNPYSEREVRWYLTWETLEDGCNGVMEHRC